MIATRVPGLAWHVRLDSKNRYVTKVTGKRLRRGARWTDVKRSRPRAATGLDDADIEHRAKVAT